MSYICSLVDHLSLKLLKMPSASSICQVPGGQLYVGLFCLIESVTRVAHTGADGHADGHADGIQTWELAYKRNEKRVSKIETPDICEVQELGGSKTLKIIHVSQIHSLIRFVLVEEDAETFLSDSSLVDSLRKLSGSCGGDAKHELQLQVAIETIRSELYEKSRQDHVSSGCTLKMRNSVRGDALYNSIIDFLNFRLGLNGIDEWNRWLLVFFESWVDSLCSLSNVPELSNFSAVTSIDSENANSKQLIYLAAEDEEFTTPMTTYEGLCYITKLCVSKCSVSEAKADEALVGLMLARDKDQGGLS
jgi:hypothetical protein